MRFGYEEADHQADRHAPFVTQRGTDRPSAPRMSGEIRKARRKGRPAARWRSDLPSAHSTRCFAPEDKCAILSRDKIRVACHQIFRLRAESTLKAHVPALGRVLVSASGKQGFSSQSWGEEVERKKSRWPSYRFQCYLRNSETVSSPPRERDRFQTVISSGSSDYRYCQCLSFHMYTS